MGNLVPSITPPSYQDNCPWLTSRCAVFSSNADSTGGGQFFTAPPVNFGAMSAAAGFSVCTWFKFNVVSPFARIFDFGNGADSSNMILTDFYGQGILSAHRFLPCQTGGNCDYSHDACFKFPTKISYGQWRHVCIVNQATYWFFYDNGVLVGSDQTPCSLANVVLTSNYLGRSNWGFDPLLQGSIAEFQIYNRAITASEVAMLHTNMIGKKQQSLKWIEIASIVFM